MTITRTSGGFSQSHGTSGTAQSTVALSATGAAVGNLVVLTVATSNASRSVASVTGGRCVGLDGGTNWTQVGVAVTSTGTASAGDAITNITMWAGVLTATSGTGSTTVTAHYDTNSGTLGDCQLDAEQFHSSVAGDVWTIDATNTSTGTGNNTMAYPSLAPSSGSALYVGYAVTGGGGSVLTGTQPQNSGFSFTVDFDFEAVRGYNPNVTGTVSPTARSGNTRRWAALAALFKAGPAAPPAVRMYLTASPSPLPDVHMTFWDQGDQVGDYVARSLALAPSGSASSASGTETHAVADWWVLLGVWVSPPLAEDTEIAGPFQFVRGRAEDPSGALLRSHMVVYAVSRDGVARATFPAHNSSSATEWPTTPTAQLISGTLAAGSCLAGDRLVFEQGYEAQNAIATPATGTIWYGDTGSPDLAAGDTDMSRPAWIEFPGPLSFEREEAPTVSAGSDATITLGATFTRTATTVDDGGQTITSRVWQIVSGPDVGTTIGTAAALSWEPELGGVYVLRYLATNSGGTGADDVTVTVNDPSDPPTVSAGPDVDLADGDTLTRTAGEDDGGSPITARLWTLVSGPE